MDLVVQLEPKKQREIQRFIDAHDHQPSPDELQHIRLITEAAEIAAETPFTESQKKSLVNAMYAKITSVDTNGFRKNLNVNGTLQFVSDVAANKYTLAFTNPPPTHGKPAKGAVGAPAASSGGCFSFCCSAASVTAEDDGGITLAVTGPSGGTLSLTSDKSPPPPTSQPVPDAPAAAPVQPPAPAAPATLAARLKH